MTEEKIIPVSVIDAKIKELETINQSGDFDEVIDILEEIKKQSLSSAVEPKK